MHHNADLISLIVGAAIALFSFLLGYVLGYFDGRKG
jgi:ABC-type dipeptide/oligopeptide/nickel transport system permease subunit